MVQRQKLGFGDENKFDATFAYRKIMVIVFSILTDISISPVSLTMVIMDVDLF